MEARKGEKGRKREREKGGKDAYSHGCLPEAQL